MTDSARPVLSIVAAVYNEQEVIAAFHARTLAVVEQLGEPFELVYVDDGSTDATPALLAELQRAHPSVRLLRLSRNFGQQAAMTAGLDYARGKAVILIDADLQDPPELIPQLVARWRGGHDVVYATRERREGESWLKRCTAHLFYRLINRLSSVAIPVDTGYYRLMDRRVVRALGRLRERNRFLKAMMSWVGFSQTAVTYVRDKRFAGTTKYR